MFGIKTNVDRLGVFFFFKKKFDFKFKSNMNKDKNKLLFLKYFIYFKIIINIYPIHWWNLEYIGHL
jgi:hypothetical protein